MLLGKDMEEQGSFDKETTEHVDRLLGKASKTELSALEDIISALPLGSTYAIRRQLEQRKKAVKSKGNEDMECSVPSTAREERNTLMDVDTPSVADTATRQLAVNTELQQISSIKEVAVHATTANGDDVA